MVGFEKILILRIFKKKDLKNRIDLSGFVDLEIFVGR